MASTGQASYEPIGLPDRMEFTQAQMRAGADGFHDRMRRRHTVREFSGAAVPRDVIERCVLTAGTAPSGANRQPWHFVAISDPASKRRIREAAEAEERRFYDGAAGDEWLAALEPVGTDASKPHLEEAPWLIVVFAQRWGHGADGTRRKNFYVPESVGIATGLLLAALHHAGLSSLTHTPNPMRFLGAMLGRPDAEKPVMIVAAGQAAAHATVPAAAKRKKPLDEILTVVGGAGPPAA